MHQIGARRVAPVHVSPAPAVRIVLEKKVVFALVENEAVRVVRPPALRRKLELRTQRLVIQIAGVFQRIALLYLHERLRILGQFVHDDRHAFSRPRAHVQRRPPVGLRVGELDVEEAFDLPIDQHFHLALRRSRLHRKMEQPFAHSDLALRIREHPRRAALAEHDLIDIDVPPAALALVHDFDARRLATQLAHIPRRRLQILVAARLRVRPRGRAHRRAVHEQVHARLARVAAAADEEVDKRPLDLELRRNQPPRRLVAAIERVRQPFARKALHRHLPRQRAVGRAAAKRRALRLPRAVVRAFKVREHDIIGRVRRGEGERKKNGGE